MISFSSANFRLPFVLCLFRWFLLAFAWEIVSCIEFMFHLKITTGIVDFLLMLAGALFCKTIGNKVSKDLLSPSTKLHLTYDRRWVFLEDRLFPDILACCFFHIIPSALNLWPTYYPLRCEQLQSPKCFLLPISLPDISIHQSLSIENFDFCSAPKLVR